MEYGARFVVGVVVGVVVFHRPIGWLRQVETSTISCGPLIQIDLYLSFICPCGGLEKHSILGHVHRRRGGGGGLGVGLGVGVVVGVRVGKVGV